MGGEKEANNTVKDGIHIQIPAERAGLTDGLGEKSQSEMWGAVQSKNQERDNLGKVMEIIQIGHYLITGFREQAL